MARKPPPKKNAKPAAAAKRKAAPPKAPGFAKATPPMKRKAKLPTLGGSLAGLGGSGAQGMIP